MLNRIVAAVGFMGAILVNGGTASATSGWIIVPGVNPGLGSQLQGVAALSASDAWAVGSYYDGSNNQLLIENWNGSAWTQVAAPSDTSSTLTAITAISPTDIWAVGTYYDINTKTGGSLTEHWNGTQWSIVPSPNVGYSGTCLVSASAISSNDVWAVGYTCDYRNAVSMHWDGTQWSIIPLAIPPGAMSGHLESVAAVGSHDVWAVGDWEDISNFYGLSEHWNGTAWKYVPTASNPFAEPLNSVTHLSGVKMLSLAGISPPYGEQWNGSTWTLLPSPILPSGSRLNAIAASPSAGIWSVGESNSGTLTLHGSTVVPSPNPGKLLGSFSGTSIVPGTQDVWAVGYAYSNAGSFFPNLIEYYSP